MSEKQDAAVTATLQWPFVAAFLLVESKGFSWFSTELEFINLVQHINGIAGWS